MNGIQLSPEGEVDTIVVENASKTPSWLRSQNSENPRMLDT